MVCPKCGNEMSETFYETDTYSDDEICVSIGYMCECGNELEEVRTYNLTYTTIQEI